MFAEGVSRQRFSYFTNEVICYVNVLGAPEGDPALIVRSMLPLVLPQKRAFGSDASFTISVFLKDPLHFS